MQNIRIFDFLEEGWEYFKKNPGLAIGGFLLYFLISLAGSWIPILNIFFAILVGPALMGGYMLFYLNMAKDNNPEIGNLFEGFNRYGTLMGIYWLMVAAIMVCMLPSIIIIAILVAVGIAEFLGVFIAFLNMIAIIFFLIRYSMTYWIIMDDPLIGVFDALKESARITEGYYAQIFLFFLLSAVIGIISFILLFLPYLVAAPVLLIGWGRFYLRLKGAGGSPEVITVVPPSTAPPAPEAPSMPPPEQTPPIDDSAPPTMPPPEDLPPADSEENKE